MLKIENLVRRILSASFQPVSRYVSADVNAMSSMTAQQARRWRIAFTLALAVLLGKVLLMILWEYRFYFPADFTSAFLSGRRHTFVGLYRGSFYLHIVAGPIAILLGAFLMASGLGYVRRAKWHRIAGRIQGVLVLFVLLPTGLVMATQAHAGSIASWGFALLSLATSGCVLAAVISARRKDFSAHQLWASRCFLLLCSPLILRMMNGSIVVLGMESQATYQWNAWFSWLGPWMVFESWRWLSRESRKPARREIHPMSFKSRARNANPSGFTLLELIGAVIIVVILLALLLPNLRFSTEAARRMSCSNNFKQIGLAIHNYDSSYEQMPPAMGGTLQSKPGASNGGRLSGLVALTPFLEHSTLWEQILHPKDFPSMGPEPWDQGFEPWCIQIPTFQCPSAPFPETPYGVTNYAFCIGDVAENLHDPDHVRGAFACGRATRLRDVLDGLANTIAMTEIGSNADRRVQGQYAINQPSTFLLDPRTSGSLFDPNDVSEYSESVELSKLGRGGCWADGGGGVALINTILPPNSPSLAVGGSIAVDGIYSAGSFHQGGAHVLMSDGAVIFITDSIESGNASQPPLTIADFQNGNTESPYGLWGALGSANAAEEIDEELNQ